MTSTTSAAQAPPPIPDEDHGVDLPMTMTASMVLTKLPGSAREALDREIERLDGGKVTIRLHPLPSASHLSTRLKNSGIFKISASQKFETVVNFVRKRLQIKSDESLFLYVNSVFAPGLDEGVGGLWRCFKTDGQLVVGYSLTPAFG